MEYKKISVEVANFVAGFLCASNKDVYEIYRRDLKRSEETEK